MTILRTVPAIAAIAAALAFGHNTWVSGPATGYEPGKTVTIEVAHGHSFPKSAEAINAAQVKLTVIAPSGARTELKAAATPHSVTASFTPREKGSHRLLMIQDRGISSRTPQGVKPGGKDRNPGAISSTWTTRISTSGSPTDKPLGTDAELLAEKTGPGRWNLSVLKNGKPLANQEVQVVIPGVKDPARAGRTDASGKLAYTASASPLLFLAEVEERAPAGANYDLRRYSLSLKVE